MKRIFLLIMIFLTLAGCDSGKLKNQVTILVPSGIPLIAVGDLLDCDKLTIDSVSGPDLLVSGMISKSHDIIIAPLNVGAKLYLNQASPYRLQAIITFGNTYLVSRKATPLMSISDVQNQDILAYGRNSIPDIILRKVLETNGVEADITYQVGIDQLIPFFVCNPDNPDDLSCNPTSYILGAEPLLSKLELEYHLQLNILNLQENDAQVIPQAAIFINPESTNIQDINAVLDLLSNNIRYLNDHPKDYAERIVGKHPYFENLGVTIIENSIPRSNITYLQAVDNREICESLFAMLNDYNPDLLGGRIPDAEFYCQ